MNQQDTVLRAGKDEAVCFTAGPKGTAFGAGAIHAWLASDRTPPLVAAGISTGALTAAAIRKCYQELENATPEKREEARWAWFRRYLDAVVESPYDFLWKSFPDPVDFFADKPPVKDLSTDLLPRFLRNEEPEARRHFHILTKFGVWLGGLPIRLRTLACIVVYYVRFSEQRGWKKCWNWLVMWSYRIKALIGLWWHLLRSPRFLWESSFRRAFFHAKKYRAERQWGVPVRPLFGWLIWFLAFLSPLILFLALFALIAIPLYARIHRGMIAGVWAFFFELTVLGFGIHKLKSHPFIKWFLPRHLLRALDMRNGLLRPFEFRRRIYDLFQRDHLHPALVADGGGECHALLVSAALQQPEQVWPTEDVTVINALSAALGIPGIFPPETRIPKKRLANFFGDDTPQLVDGVAVRDNPIPAFFDWCHKHTEVARRLERDDGTPSLHVVYNVPIRPKGSVAKAKGADTIDIVDAALLSLALEKRRDTRQEVRQAEFISRLEYYRQIAKPGDPRRAKCPRFKVTADEIAPEDEIDFDNPSTPSRENLLRLAAQGCRETLEILYRSEIDDLADPAGVVSCAVVLRAVGGRRKSFIRIGDPGVSEVCGSCPRMLRRRRKHVPGEPPEGVIQSYGKVSVTGKADAAERLPHLARNHPRIVFLGSGGVFRGAFHVGVIGAMKAARVFPDLVVGASVGTLMGGALATIAVSDEKTENGILEALASTFLNVDERVALTRTLKNAAKQLGIRARRISLSPSEVRRCVARGSRSDPGFAATGAPPSLIDAISSLFMIPHRLTAEIASDFVAGHFSDATNRFLQAVREETLKSFGIEKHLMGISLLQNQAEKLMGAGLAHVRGHEVQPWHYPVARKRPVRYLAPLRF